jgi:hypothetical protein
MNDTTPVPATNNDNLHTYAPSLIKKGKKKGNSKVSNNLCIKKNAVVKKVKRATAEMLIKTEGWTFTNRGEWKKTVRDVKGFIPDQVVVAEVVKKKAKVLKTDKKRKSKEET